MPTGKYFAPFVIALAVLLEASAATTQARYSSVSLIVRFVGYAGAVYTAPPLSQSQQVYFPGEPIRFELVFVNNRGDSPITLQALADPRSTFSVRSLLGTPFEPALSDDVRLQTVFGERPIDWSSEFLLNADESLIIRGEIVSAGLPPGEHAISFSTTMRDSQGLLVVPQSTRLQLEMRESSTESAIEELRRHAARALIERDFLTAERWIDALRKAHPKSYASYVVEAQIAEFQKTPGRARAAYQQAIALLQSRSDQRHASFERSPRVTQDLIDALMQRVRAIEVASIP